MASPRGKRLDTALVQQGLCETLEAARALILSGNVLVNQHRVDKAGASVAADAVITLKNPKVAGGWVSRAAHKLLHGLDYFEISPQGHTVIDVGACTGGFTEVLLHHGAEKVYAVDVGYGELAWKLRQDARVVVMERQNARHLTSAEIVTSVDGVVCDASFIPLQRVLPAALGFVKPGGWLIALIKPQFELPAALIPEGGIVQDTALHRQACNAAVAWVEQLPAWQVLGVTESPIKGMEGNTEFLLAAGKYNKDGTV